MANTPIFWRLGVAAAGFLPVLSVALCLGGWVSLWLTVLVVITPAWAIVAAYGMARPAFGRVMVVALFAGMAATVAYDVVRLSLSNIYELTDGIPNIGRMLFDDMNAPLYDVYSPAYFYRYLGDGGGLALAYAMGRRYSVLSGMAFGTFVCLCLWATLYTFPEARTLLFPLTATGLTITMVGHWVYGGVLGTLLAYFLPVDAVKKPAASLPTITLTVTEGALPPVLDRYATPNEVVV